MPFIVKSLQITTQYKITITIQESEEDGPTIRIIKRYGFSEEELLPARIVNGVNFGWHMSADDAIYLAEWLRIAARAAQALDAIIETREDLKRPIAVRMVVNTVTVTFADE